MNNVNNNTDTLEKFLKNYDDSKYEKPSVTADIVIFSREKKDELKVLLIKRGNHPYKGMYALPGGFANSNEDLDNTARRELFEETGLECDMLEQLRCFSEPGRDPRRWVITCAYIALINASEYKIEAGDDASAAEWFSVSLKEVTHGGYDKAWELILNGDELAIKVIIVKTGVDKLSRTLKLSVLESENIAFDHGLILAYALEKIEILTD